MDTVILLLEPYRPWLMPVLAFLLLLVGIALVVATARIAKANRRLVATVEAQARHADRPIVVVRPMIDPVTMIIFLKIANIGRSPAENLELSMNKPFHQFGDRQRNRNVAGFHAFDNILPSFPPGQELSFHLGTGANLFGERRDEDATPPLFKVAAKYLYDGSLIEEETTLDLRQLYMNATMPIPLRQELENINRTLQEIASLWKNSSIADTEPTES